MISTSVDIASSIKLPAPHLIKLVQFPVSKEEFATRLFSLDLVLHEQVLPEEFNVTCVSSTIRVLVYLDRFLPIYIIESNYNIGLSGDIVNPMYLVAGNSH